MKNKYLIITCLLLFPFSTQELAWGKQNNFIEQRKGRGPKRQRDRLIGNIIKDALETYHYRRLKVDDNLSQKAFGQFLKKVDYGKQFLLKKDVDKLKKFQKKMDNQMVSGRLSLLQQSMEIIRKRIQSIAKYQETVFKKSFNFNRKETLESDPDKRSYLKSERELKEHWRKVFKQATISRYLSLLEQKEDEIKEAKEAKEEKEKKKKITPLKPKKYKTLPSGQIVEDPKILVTKKKKGGDKEMEPLAKLSKKQLKKKAQEAISKKYKKFFARLLKANYDDYLEKFFNAVSNVFDPHTNYLPPKRKEDFDIDISGSLEGIGAVLEEDGSFIKVVKIVTGGAAWRQKDLEVGDIILNVRQGKKGEPVDLVDMRVDDAVRYIRGKKGTTVVLYVKKVGKGHKSIAIVRDVIELGASFAKSSVIQHKDLKIKVGHLQVPKFYRDFGNNRRNCTDDVKKELLRLKKLKIDALVLDLRNNGGGALEDARQMSGLFIKEGPIVQVRNHIGKIEVLRDKDSSITYNGPLIVLINRFSASASEILAGALQDYGRAIIVGGEHSHGKGTVQAVLNLNQGPLVSMFGPTIGALKVTIQMFYRVTGVSTQFRGITPHIILPDPFGYTKNREKDLEFALPWDQVEARRFTPWPSQPQPKDLALLKKRSQQRVDKNKRFQRIKESVSYLVKKREQTEISLNIKDLIREEEVGKKMSEKLKLDEENEDILVTHYEASLKLAHKIRPGDEEKWKSDFEQRKKEWKKTLRRDATLEESLYILNDVITLAKGKQLAADI